ncbi:SDR family oxidoreductase [Coralloluteibacterium thermophilus]|uniref:SDR family oxidoreductase n=1 Tax=Coralloluteibacterium thermophilum TaxID=2707049 RepID=A0ABV9NJC1_9GAMM
MHDTPIDLPVVVITGASSGIGRATALQFAKRGARLVLAARDAEALETLVHLCDTYGTRALAVPTDVTDAEAVARLAHAAVEFGGAIDVWVNNAGVGAVGAFDEVPLAAHEQVIDTDLLGYVRGAHAVLPHFRAQGRGVLINVLSLGSWVGQPFAASYSAAKFGLRGFSEALRGELADAPGIHVCDIYPSFVDTPAFGTGANYSGHKVSAPTRGIDPRRVAEAIVRTSRRPRPVTPVGVMTHVARMANALVPGFTLLSGRITRRALERQPMAEPTDGNLFESAGGLRQIDGGNRRGGNGGQGMAIALGVVGVAAVAGLVWWSRHRAASKSHPRIPHLGRADLDRAVHALAGTRVVREVRQRLAPEPRWKRELHALQARLPLIGR